MLEVTFVGPGGPTQQPYGAQHGLRVLSSSVVETDNWWHPANIILVAVPEADPCHSQK